MTTRTIDILLRIKSAGASSLDKIKRGAGDIDKALKGIPSAGASKLKERFDKEATAARNLVKSIKDGDTPFQSLEVLNNKLNDSLSKLGRRAREGSDELRQLAAAQFGYERTLEDSTKTEKEALDVARKLAIIQGASSQRAEELAKQAKQISGSTKQSAQDLANLVRGLSGISSGDAVRGFKALVQLTKAFRTGTAGVVLSLKNIKVAAASTLGTILALTGAAVGTSAEFREAEQRTGLAARALGDFRSEFQQTVVNGQLQDFQEFVLNVTERFGEAAKDAGAIRDSLKETTRLSTFDIIDLSFKGPQEQIDAVIEGINKAENDSQRLFRIRDLAAEDGARSLPFITETPEQRALLRERRALVRVGDEGENTKRLNEVSFAFIELRTLLADFSQSLSSNFAPALAEITKLITLLAATFARANNLFIGNIISTIFDTIAVTIKQASFFATAFVNILENGLAFIALEGQRLIDIFTKLKNLLPDLTPDDDNSILISQRQADRNFLFGFDANNGLRKSLSKITITEGNTFDELTEARNKFSKDTKRLIEEDDDLNAETISKRIRFLRELVRLDTGEQLNQIRNFSSTGLLPTENDEVVSTLTEIEQKYAQIVRESNKIAPQFASSGDTTALEEARLEVIEARKEVEELNSSIIKDVNKIALLNLRGLLDDSAARENIKQVRETLQIKIQEVERLENREAKVFAETEANERLASLRSKASLDKEAAFKLALEEDILKIRTDNIVRLEQSEIDSLVRLRQRYRTIVEEPARNSQLELDRLRSTDFSSIESIDPGDALQFDENFISVTEAVSNKLNELNQKFFDGVIDQDAAIELKQRARDLGDQILAESRSIIFRNRELFKDDALDLGELFNADFSSATDINQALREITDLRIDAENKLNTALEKNIISEKESIRTKTELLSIERILNEQAERAVEFSDSQIRFSARDLSGIRDLDVSDTRDLANTLNEIRTTARDEEIEVGAALRLGKIDEEESSRLLNVIDAEINLLSQRARDLVAQNIAQDVNQEILISDILGITTDSSLTDLVENQLNVEIARDNKIKALERLFDLNITPEQRQAIENAIDETSEIANDKLRELANSANQVNVAEFLTGGTDPNELGDDFQNLNNRLSRFSAILERLSQPFRGFDDTTGVSSIFSSLGSLDLQGIGSFSEGLQRITDARNDALTLASNNDFIENRLQVRGIIDADTDRAELLRLIEEERDSLESEILDYFENLEAITLPIQYTIEFIGQANEIFQEFGSILNTFQQNDLANRDKDLSDRAELITQTQDRLREAIEAGNINEVRSSQDKLNALVSIQRQEEAAARKKFEENKKQQIAFAKINVLAGVAQALSLGFPQGLFAAAAVLAQGVATIDGIKRTEFESSSGLGGVGSLGGDDLSNNTDLNTLSGSLSAQDLIEAGRDDDDNNDSNRRRRDIRVSFPDQGLLTAQMARDLFNEIAEQRGDNQFGNIIVD